MKVSKTLVFVGAHPDDESFGVGGTLAQYAAIGFKVYYIYGTRDQAAVCHASQLSGGSSRGGLLGLINKVFGQRDSFMRAEPPVKGHLYERDLFKGVV